jgi:hypothetical protein
MSDQRRESAVPVEPYFDRTPQPFGDGPPDPLVYDASPRMLRQRTAAKRLVDMRYVPCCGVKGGILFTAAVETAASCSRPPSRRSASSLPIPGINHAFAKGDRECEIPGRRRRSPKPWVEFARDSPLEGEGFEPPVPRRDSIFETAPEPGDDKPAR